MKRNKKLFFVLVFPYFLTMAFLLVNWEWLYDQMAEVFYFLPIPMYLIAFIVTVMTIVRNQRREDETAEEILRVNMVIKLIQIPAYFVNFWIGIGFFATVVLMGAVIVPIILDVLSIFLTGLLGASGVVKACREKKLSVLAGFLNAWMQFVFCLDVISAVYLYVKVREKKTKPEKK